MKLRRHRPEAHRRGKPRFGPLAGRYAHRWAGLDSRAPTIGGAVAARATGAAGGPGASWQLAMVAGAAVHHGFELGAGAGLMLQRELGLPGAVLTWATVLPGLGMATWRRPSHAQRLLAAATGANLAAVVVHYALWPWHLRLGVPVLTSAEGLAPDHLPAYNSVLVSWGAAGLGALLRDVPVGQRRWALAGFVAALPLRQHAVRHFRWLRQQSRTNPAWWNRAPRRSAGLQEP